MLLAHGSGVDVISIFSSMFDKMDEIMCTEFDVAGWVFNLWDVFVIAALMTGAGLILAAGMGEE